MTSVFSRRDLQQLQNNAQERRNNEIHNNINSIIQRIQKDIMKEIKDGTNTKYKHTIQQEKYTFYNDYYDEIMSKLNELFPGCDIKMMRNIRSSMSDSRMPDEFVEIFRYQNFNDISGLCIIIDWS